MTPDLPPQLEVVDGIAGGSAAREFDRRHDARQQRVQTNHPKIGRLLLAVFDDPQSTKAWSTGAVGEQRLGGMLAQIAGPAIRVLNDRRIPRSTANIDHLVVCPTGVFVVDAKRYRDARPELRVEGGLIRPREELLIVGGRERTTLVEGMHKQLDLVRTALAGERDGPVQGVLCFVDADWPVIGGSFTVQGVSVMWPKKLRSVLTAAGPLDPDRIADVQWQLHEAFPRQRDSRSKNW
ncbi:MAG: NERD domain-containing protein [Actinobacteria bacterium]|nr:NERD domain-containing protein [Actinomycetota bacterium]